MGAITIGQSVIIMDKLECMRAFAHVVETGGFAAAARKLGLSRSQVNKLVASLEDHLQVQLLHRTTRRVTPTDTGLAFYDRCLAILTDVADAEQSVLQLHTEPKGTLRINAPMSFGTRHLAPALMTFLAQYPDLKVELALNDRFIDPIAEGFDLTMRISEPFQTTSLVSHRLLPTQRVLCAAPVYLAAHPSPQHPHNLAEHSCLHYGHLPETSQWHLIGPDGEHRITVRGRLCSNNGEALREAALKGLGIALLPRFIVAPDLEAGHLQVVLPAYQPPEIFIYVLYPVNRHLSTKIRLLTAFLKVYFHEAFV
ncbi:LysR family transcriptional regulator [Trichothermofontia sp.]